MPSLHAAWLQERTDVIACVMNERAESLKIYNVLNLESYKEVAAVRTV